MTSAPSPREFVGERQDGDVSGWLPACCGDGCLPPRVVLPCVCTLRGSLPESCLPGPLPALKLTAPPACRAACRVPEGTQAAATFLAKASGVLAGAWVAHAVFARVDPTVSLKWLKKDGETVVPGDIIGEAHGSARCVVEVGGEEFFAWWGRQRCLQTYWGGTRQRQVRGWCLSHPGLETLSVMAPRLSTIQKPAPTQTACLPVAGPS